jgi:hypothetical protein
LNNGIITTTPLLRVGTYNLIVNLVSETGSITTTVTIKINSPPMNIINANIKYNQNIKEKYYDSANLSDTPTIVGDVSGIYVESYTIFNIPNDIENKVFIDNNGILTFEENIPIGTYNITIKATFNDQRFITTIYTLRVKSRPLDLYLPHIYDIYGNVTRNDSISVADITQDFLIEEDSDNSILSLSTLKPLLKMRDNININNIQTGDLPSIVNASDTKNQIKGMLSRPSFKTSNNTNERLTFQEHYKMAVSNNILGNKEIELPSTIKTELEKDVSNFNIGDIFIGENGLDDIVVRRFLLKQLKELRPERFIDEEDNLYKNFPIQEGDYIILRIKTESAIVKDMNTSQTSSINKLLKHLSRINQLSNYTVDNANNVIKVAPKLWSIKLKLGA